MRIRYLTPAREEFLAAVEFYEQEAPGLGGDFDAEIQDLERRLIDHPNSGAPFGEGIRRALLPSFPFSLVYRVREQEIVVLAIAHQRRRPGYWLGRLG